MYTQYICIHTSAHIYLYMIPYTYICFHTISFIYHLLSFTNFYAQRELSPYSTIYFNAYIRIHVYILLGPNTPYTYLHDSVPTSVHFHIYCYDHPFTLLHSSTTMYAVYMFTHICVHIPPKHVYIHLRSYTQYPCLHNTAPIFLYMITHFCALIPVHVYKHIRPYSYICLHICTPIYLHMFTLLYAHLRSKHIHLRSLYI